eukprot:9472795-Pyramimonas_sp.AAC.1
MGAGLDPAPSSSSSLRAVSFSEAASTRSLFEALSPRCSVQLVPGRGFVKILFFLAQVHDLHPHSRIGGRSRRAVGLSDLAYQKHGDAL